MQIKQIDVDWDDEQSLKKALNEIRSRLGDLTSSSKKQNNRDRFNACRAILDTDISSVFQELSLDVAPNYYVYAHLDTARKIAIGRDGATTFAATLGLTHFPFYVGKGTGDRFLNFSRNETHRKVVQKLSNLSLKPEAVKIAEGLSESEALALESKLIDIFGLIPFGGILTNLDEGINKDARRACYQTHFNSLRRMNRIL